MYFWINYDQKGIDLIEEIGGKLYAYEFKLRPGKKQKIPKEFLNTYPGSSHQIVGKNNFWRFVSE
jgi:hypothetical protein